MHILSCLVLWHQNIAHTLLQKEHIGDMKLGVQNMIYEKEFTLSSNFNVTLDFRVTTIHG